MAFQPGYKAYVGLANAANTVVNIQPYIDTVDHTQSVEQLEVSVLGTVAKAFLPGLTDGDTITISGPYDVTLFTQLGALKAAQAAGSAAGSLIWGPGGSVASQARINSTVYVASLGLSAGVGGRAEISASLQVTGAVVNTTF